MQHGIYRSGVMLRRRFMAMESEFYRLEPCNSDARDEERACRGVDHHTVRRSNALVVRNGAACSDAHAFIRDDPHRRLLHSALIRDPQEGEV